MEREFNFVIATNCKVCNEGFKEAEILITLGKPYHCILHRRCYYLFDFSKGWPHPQPLKDYEFYCQVLESALNLERVNFLNQRLNEQQLTNSSSCKKNTSQ